MTKVAKKDGLPVLLAKRAKSIFIREWLEVKIKTKTK
jgi:hypothetical protein